MYDNDGNQYYEEFITHMKIRDIWLNIDKIIEKGVSIDKILDLPEPYVGYFDSHYRQILGLGANPRHLFDLNEEWYKMRTGFVKELTDTFHAYIDRGLDRLFVKLWLEQYLDPDDIVDYADILKYFGLDAQNYIWYWLENNAYKCIRHIDSLPKCVKPDDVIEHFSIKEIKNYFTGDDDGRYCGFGVFISRFLKAGGTLDLLADKFVKELGYPEDEDDLTALTLMAGEGTKHIDANQIVDALTPKARYYNDPASVKRLNAWFYEMLEDRLDDAHKEKLTN